MNFRTATSLLLVVLCFTQQSLALRGGDLPAPQRELEGGQSGQGGQQGLGQQGNTGDRPFGSEKGSDRPSFIQNFVPDIEPITCEADFGCDLANGSAGTFICRKLTHPITGESRARSKCIPYDRAWSTDECGCCGETCKQKEFSPLTCDASTQPDATAVSRANGDDTANNLNLQVVCRDVFNPFTGQKTNATMRVPSARALEDDECGCCDGVCPERGDKTFERPDFVPKSCAAPEQVLLTCDLPKKKNGDQQGAAAVTSEAAEEGFFVCRSLYNVNSQELKKEAVCISEERAWDTDECGCCGADCPEKPRPVDIDCTKEDQICDLKSGEQGVFVCRSIFHPFDGQVRDRGFCIPNDRAWVTDTCGCCDSGCPDTPPTGFPDEDTQLVRLALEIPDDYANIATTDMVDQDEPNDSGAFTAKKMVTVLLSAVLAVAF